MIINGCNGWKRRTRWYIAFNDTLLNLITATHGLAISGIPDCILQAQNNTTECYLASVWLCTCFARGVLGKHLGRSGSCMPDEEDRSTW